MAINGECECGHLHRGDQVDVSTLARTRRPDTDGVGQRPGLPRPRQAGHDEEHHRTDEQCGRHGQAAAQRNRPGGAQHQGESDDHHRDQQESEPRHLREPAEGGADTDRDELDHLERRLGVVLPGRRSFGLRLDQIR
jgi:hypothetical protein